MAYIRSMNRAIDYIEENLTQAIDLRRVAAAAGYSAFHFSRLFLAETGLTPRGYIRRRRLSEAARELLCTRRRILDIALDYQFQSQAAFTRAFRAAFGTSPGAYRKRGRSARLLQRITLRHVQISRVNGGCSSDARVVLPGHGTGKVLPARLCALVARTSATRMLDRSSSSLYLVLR